MNVERFWEVAERDLRALRPLNITVLAAGPLSMYGTGRQVADYFDKIHHATPAVADPAQSSFLQKLLDFRGAAEYMDRPQKEQLCRYSGGVLRDLISLAHSAGENAYLENEDRIEERHVLQAVRQLGNGYRLGIGTMQLSLLRSMLHGGGFTPSDPAVIDLILTRRMLAGSTGSNYVVHPALAFVLEREER